MVVKDVASSTAIGVFVVPKSFEISGRVQTGRGILLGTYGFGSLAACPEKLTVNALLMSAITFKPSEVVSIEVVPGIPILYWGIRIKHLKEDCPKIVGFLSWSCRPGDLISGIELSGFVPVGKELQPCLNCGEHMSSTVDICAKCGWTFTSQ